MSACLVMSACLLMSACFVMSSMLRHSATDLLPSMKGTKLITVYVRVKRKVKTGIHLNFMVAVPNG